MRYDSPGVAYDTPGIIYDQAALPGGADGGDTFGDYPAAVAAARKRAATRQRGGAIQGWPSELEQDFVTVLGLGLLD